MTSLTRLKACVTFNDLAGLLGFKPKNLAYILWGMNPAVKYSQFDIPKRSGGKRTILAPNAKLKLAQSNLARILQDCEQEINKTRNIKNSASHGFKKSHSILTNAERHRARRHVLNIDLKDFFGTIHFGRVRGFFIKNRLFELKESVATAIAQIACHAGILPQGSPCSPVISNLLGNILDVHLRKLARLHGCAYTRYADDITFSTALPEFPTALAYKISCNKWELGGVLENTVSMCRFTINHSKTRLQYRHSRQDVTGIIVNRHLNVRSEYRRTLRAMVHRLRSTGSFSRTNSALSQGGETQSVTQNGTRAQLLGMLSFVLQVEKWRNRTVDEPPAKLSTNEWLMREFLFYTMFANPERPCILCEGKTDSIYIREAIKSLGNAFPLLAKTDADGSTPTIKIVRDSDLLGRLFGLTGGETRLTNFVRNYSEEYRKVNGPRGTHPVIVLFDNDSGAKDVLHYIKKRSTSAPQTGQQHFHVHENLYVVLTSPIEQQGHYIEKCFEQATLELTLGGKKFNPTNHKLKSDEYGKGFFAEKIVAQNAASINFAGFNALLTAFSHVIESYVPLPPAPV